MHPISNGVLCARDIDKGWDSLMVLVSNTSEDRGSKGHKMTSRDGYLLPLLEVVRIDSTAVRDLRKPRAVFLKFLFLF